MKYTVFDCETLVIKIYVTENGDNFLEVLYHRCNSCSWSWAIGLLEEKLQFV